MTMRAFVLTRYGGPEAMELRDVPRPSPGAGEVLIQVYAAGLNPIDFKLRQGMLRVIYRYSLPIIAGSELSGVVVATGSGVTRLAEGDRVFTRVDKQRLGAFAEFAVVREELVATNADLRRFPHSGRSPAGRADGVASFTRTSCG